MTAGYLYCVWCFAKAVLDLLLFALTVHVDNDDDNDDGEDDNVERRISVYLAIDCREMGVSFEIYSRWDAMLCCLHMCRLQETGGPARCRAQDARESVRFVRWGR